MASLVLLAPVPAMMGMRPRAVSRQTRITSRCSSTSRVADSPVVPTATMPSVPCPICHSTSFFSAAQSTARVPDTMGVIIATILPVIIQCSPRKNRNGTGVAGSEQARPAMKPAIRPLTLQFDPLKPATITCTHASGHTPFPALADFEERIECILPPGAGFKAAMGPQVLIGLLANKIFHQGIDTD